MNYTFTILWIAALLCLSQQSEARTQRLLFADEAVQQAELSVDAAQNGKPEQQQIDNTQNTDKKTEKTEVQDDKTKHECAEEETEEDDNILIIDADELQRILLLAEEAQGRATRRYNLRLRRGPSRGGRRPLVRAGRRRGGLRRVRPNRNRNRNRNGQIARRATIRRRTG